MIDSILDALGLNPAAGFFMGALIVVSLVTFALRNKFDQDEPDSKVPPTLM